MPRHPDLEAVVAIYAGAPDTPNKPSRRDWAIAQHLLDSGISLDTFKAAVALASLRRKARSDDDLPLEPIHSLAFFKPLARHLHQNPPDPGYLEYLYFKFGEVFPGSPSPFQPNLASKSAVHRQNLALFNSRQQKAANRRRQPRSPFRIPLQAETKDQVEADRRGREPKTVSDLPCRSNPTQCVRGHKTQLPQRRKGERHSKGPRAKS